MIRQYKRGERIAPNFTADEFLCKCAACRSAGVVYLDEGFAAKLQGFRVHIGKPISITSGNRCAAHNAAVKGASSSRHLTPKHADGADIRVAGIVPDELAVMAEAFGFTGVGVYSASNNYIHVDTRPGARTCWWLKTSGSNTPGFGGVACAFRVGHRSPAIKEIQRVVGVAQDGAFGAKTEVALKAWQSAHGLAGSGVFDGATNARMGLFKW